MSWLILVYSCIGLYAFSMHRFHHLRCCNKKVELVRAVLHQQFHMQHYKKEINMSVVGGKKRLLHPVLKGSTLPVNHREHSVWIRRLQDAHQRSSSSRILLWSHKGVTVATVVRGLSLQAGWKAWKIAPLRKKREPAVGRCCRVGVWEPWCTLACCVFPCQSFRLQVSSHTTDPPAPGLMALLFSLTGGAEGRSQSLPNWILTVQLHSWFDCLYDWIETL